MKKIILALALLALPSIAVAQTPEERVESAKARIAAAGIPLSLIEAKIADGKAKGVPMERLAAAVEKRAESLQAAHEAIRRSGDPADADELGAAADAVELGVSEAVLLELSGKAGRERRGAAIAALTELVAGGHVPAEAFDRVVAALARGDDALANLPEQAGSARARRGPPAGVGRSGGAPGSMSVPAGMPAPGQAAGARRPPLGRPVGS